MIISVVQQGLFSRDIFLISFHKIYIVTPHWNGPNSDVPHNTFVKVVICGKYKNLNKITKI